ncbi:MAG: nif-specific transcriptional activator NifA [Nitrospirae bacterium]|nr:nif-specific transcriptional activator NifA [Nitrospirota bacterium]MBI3353246.1 nif-specific transcriptional activator NifA [Nitrospirota bacterium]
MNEVKILELTALYEISKALAWSLDLKVTSTKIMEILSSILGMRRGTLTLLHPETGELVIETAHGLSQEEISRGRYRPGEGITGKVLETGEAIVIPDIGKEPLFLNKTGARPLDSRKGISFICVPVKVAGETIGVFSADRLFDESVSPQEDLRVLTIVSSLIGQSIKLHQLITIEKERLMDQNRQLQGELKNKYGIKNVVGQSPKMVEVYEAVERVSKSKATVLLRGESGTGKELIAKAIHFASPRAEKPFLKINCGAIPENLLESELFGHEKGAFTGATEMRKGRFEMAHGGTLFLDEIGEMPLNLQVKILRVLQEMKFERLGSSKTISVDVRLVAATHEDLEKSMTDGTFREDLYYRLNVVPIHLPPLRDRKEDIPMLVSFFLKKYNEENGSSIQIDSGAMKMLMEYNWPGNVRELENTIERMVVMAETNSIQKQDVVKMFMGMPAGGNQGDETPDERTGDLPFTVESVERVKIIQALNQCNGIQAKAAKLLGITPRQIGYKIKKYKIQGQMS